MSPRAALTRAGQAVLRNPCNYNCDQGRQCNCGNRPTFATTSDPLAWVPIDPPAPTNARRIPRARLPLRLADWVAALVFVAAVLGACALADMPSTVLLQGWI